MEELPKIETINVNIVKAVRITIGTMIDADSGASRLSQHLRNNILLYHATSILHIVLTLFVGME